MQSGIVPVLALAVAVGISFKLASQYETLVTPIASAATPPLLTYRQRRVLQWPLSACSPPSPSASPSTRDSQHVVAGDALTALRLHADVFTPSSTHRAVAADVVVVSVTALARLFLSPRWSRVYTAPALPKSATFV